MLRQYFILYTLLIYTTTYSYNKTNSLVLLFSLFYRQELSSTEDQNCQSSHSYYMAEPVFKPRQPESHPHVILPLVFK